ncbi:MAG TPA: AAA family ATPase [Syntrophales bacterium]|nr:AAA family ATPase [Syntrophales bacterium]HQN76732.1 AAA family ATPase [Syntrophales bacterium]HQQ26085.1 AAA family ATPase [Syntrophales bacterium]
MYYEYWSLKKPPFDNVPDPSMYVDIHDSMENAIAETLFAIEEGNECLAVIVGDVGLGKTLSLRLIIDSLEADRYRIALITNPDMSFPQLLREIIGQLAGTPCTVKRKVDLLETFNRLLFTTCEEGKKVLVFIDEANAISPPNLESLRLLTNMQDDAKNLFTIVLAGQKELGKRLEHPSRANLYQRIGTYCRIGKIDSPDKLKQYVDIRLRQAGAVNGDIFTADAIVALWEHSEEGVPRLINKLCKLCLKAGETNGFRRIDGGIVGQVAERFAKRESRETARKSRKKTERSSVEAKPVERESGTIEPRLFMAEAAEPPMERPGIVPSLAVHQEEERVPPQAPAAETVLPVEETPADGPSLHAAALAEEVPADAPVLEAAPLPEEGLAEAPLEEAVPGEEVRDPGETLIGNYRIHFEIPPDVLREAKTSNPEYRTRIAGSLAARAMNENPQLVSSPAADPVVIWSEIKEALLRRLVA